MQPIRIHNLTQTRPWSVMYNRSNPVHHLLANCGRRGSTVHLLGSQAQSFTQGFVMFGPKFNFLNNSAESLFELMFSVDTSTFIQLIWLITAVSYSTTIVGYPCCPKITGIYWNVN